MFFHGGNCHKRSSKVKKPLVLSAALLGIGASLAVRAAAKLLDEIGELSDATALGYAPENAVPVASHPGFRDTSWTCRTCDATV
jgi:hypothetical protein